MMLTVIIVIAIILIPLTFLRLRLGPPNARLDPFGAFAARLGYGLLATRRRPRPGNARRAEVQAITAILEEL